MYTVSNGQFIISEPEENIRYCEEHDNCEFKNNCKFYEILIKESYIDENCECKLENEKYKNEELIEDYGY